MLLNAVEVTNSRGSVLSLPLEDISEGFVVKNIDGLGPVKATLVSSSFANMDGEQYHSSRRDARNIKVTLGLQPDYAVKSVQDLRDQLYDYFMPKSAATMKFRLFDKFSTNLLKQWLDLQIDARIESADPVIFAQDPAIDISLMCYDPDFYDPATVEFDGNTVSDLTETILTYDGSVDTGVVFTLKPNRAMTEVTIYYRPPDQTLHTIDLSYPLAAGDILQISSVPGSKFVTNTRAGVVSSLLYAVTPQSDWLTLQPGDNSIRVYASGAPVPYSITYTNKYGGL